MDPLDSVMRHSRTATRTDADVASVQAPEHDGLFGLGAS